MCINLAWTGLARLLVLGLLGTFQYSALRKFLAAQKLARPGMYVQAPSKLGITDQCDIYI
jgi:hypothetical protein